MTTEPGASRFSEQSVVGIVARVGAAVAAGLLCKWFGAPPDVQATVTVDNRGQPSWISLKRWQSSNRFRMISGIHRSANTSAARATGQYCRSRVPCQQASSMDARRVKANCSFCCSKVRLDAEPLLRRRAIEGTTHDPGGMAWPRTTTTRSSSARAAPGRRPRCCWPARATGSWSSTGRRSRATRSRPTSSTRRAWRRCSAGGCSTGSSRPAARRSTRTRSTSARSRSRARPAPTSPRSRTARGAPCSTSCSSTPPPRPAPRSARRSPSTDLVIEDGRVVGIRGHGKGGADRHRARPGGRRRRRPALAGRPARCAPEQYHEKPQLLCGYYTYWSGLPMDGRFEVYIRPDRGFAAWPDQRRPDARRRRLAVRGVRGQQARRRGQLPEDVRAGAGVRRPHPRRHAARRASSAPRCPNFFRKPYGPGWALVGDAGYNKDFITAQGISDAFRDAELCADGAATSRSPAPRPFDDAMGDYQATRDAHVLPMYEFTSQLATLEPPPPEMQQLLGAVHGNQDAMDGFARVNAGRDLTGRVLRRRERRPHPRHGRDEAGDLIVHESHISSWGIGIAEAHSVRPVSRPLNRPGESGDFPI